MFKADFKSFWSHFKVFLGANWTKRLLEAFLQFSYTRGRPLEPLGWLSNHPRNVADDIGLGSHSAVAVQYTKHCE